MKAEYSIYICVFCVCFWLYFDCNSVWNMNVIFYFRHLNIRYLFCSCVSSPKSTNFHGIHTIVHTISGIMNFLVATVLALFIYNIIYAYQKYTYTHKIVFFYSCHLFSWKLLFSQVESLNNENVIIMLQFALLVNST